MGRIRQKIVRSTGLGVEMIAALVRLRQVSAARVPITICYIGMIEADIASAHAAVDLSGKSDAHRHHRKKPARDTRRGLCR
jgi:hypothetical protein